MDALAISGTDLSPFKNFEDIVDYRAEIREHLRGRNNVTSCRSPTRELDTRRIKAELQEKRHLEFQRRRSVSPEPSAKHSKRRPSPKIFSMKHRRPTSKTETMTTNIQTTPTSNGRPLTVLTPNSSMTVGPSTSNWALFWSDEVTPVRQVKDNLRTQTSVSTSPINESNQQWTKSTVKRGRSVHVQKTISKTNNQTEKITENVPIQRENILHKIRLSENSVQTESGLVIVKESDIQVLSELLQEALWREEALKKKLSSLQERTTNLVSSSNKIWTARCSEDLLRNKIKALEAQLQVCLLKFPKDGVKQVVIQMEKQKQVYEERAMEALQKATLEKTDALTKTETLQEALTSAQTEAMRWQCLYEELKLNCGYLMENQNHSKDKLQQLHSQLELSRLRESKLRDEVLTLIQEKKELQYNISLLDQDNQIFREEIQHLRDDSDESQDFMMLSRLTLEEADPQRTERGDSLVEEQLRHTQEKLRLKEKECEELRTDLGAMEQECQSSQARLSQCRDELRQLSLHHRRPTPCSSWWKMWIVLLLFLAVAQVAMLWLWYPPFREQAEDLYSDIETRIEDYLMEMASPQHSGCFRPI